MNASIPDPRRLAAVEKLFAWPHPYDLPEGGDALFVQAMREVTAWHRERNAFYGRLANGFDETGLETAEDCAAIPFVPAEFFKLHELLSVPRESIALHVTSSGTTGQKSQMFYDGWSRGCGFLTLDRMFEHSGWVTSKPARYILFTYEAEPGTDLGTAYTDYYTLRYAPVEELFLALRRTSATEFRHEFDAFGTVEALRRYADGPTPVRIFGFPYFLWFTLERMRALDLPPLRLPRESLIVVSGGWKGHADQAVSKEALIRRCGEQLGVPPERVRDYYGAVEHGLPYLDCPHHRLHIPVYSRAFIRNPETLELQGWGEPGILHFVAPHNTSSPAHSLLTGDNASLFPPEACGCGLKTPFMVVHGRAGTRRNRSCAIAAAELLRGRS